MLNLMQGDCLERMKEIPDGSVDMILTDPPYGTTACKWDSVIDFDLMWEQLNRIIKPNGAVSLFGSEPFSSALRLSNVKNYKYDWVWNKSKSNGFFNVKKMPLKNIECISVFYKKQCTYNPQGLKPCNKVIKTRVGDKSGKHKSAHNGGKIKVDTYKQTAEGYPNQSLFYKKPNKTAHPTQKPVALMEYLIKTYTNENETVLDFTMGSGTTGVACVNTNRDFIGIELDETYFNIAKQRIANTVT